jgi:hypothetical protein
MLGRQAILWAAALGLAGCSSPMPSLTNELASVERIERECRAFGLIRRPASLALDLIPVPGVKPAAELIAIGVDQVCADPIWFAHIEGTVAWIAKNARK